jgi:limonene-1,2-epoxide hydrolase
MKILDEQGAIEMSEHENRAAVERYWDALSKQDFEAAAAELHDDFVETYPQSGERIRGTDNWMGLVSNYPGFPAVRVLRHLGSGEVWVTQAEFDYARDGSAPWQICQVQECRNGKIESISGYFAAPFEAAEWRAAWVERG